MPAPAKTLISYVPALVARRFEDNPRLIIKPTATYLKGTVLGLHLSGLAELVKRLINPAAAASDDLNRLLKTTFERLVDMFVAHGGDVFKFSEDTLLAMWTTETSQERVEATVLRAAQCALALQTNFHHQPIMPDLRLSLRVTIGAGEILTTDLGGVYGRWEFLISGNPLSQVRQLEAQAQPGQVILSREAWSLVEDKVQGQTQDQGCYRLQAVRSPLPLASLPRPALTPQAEAALRGYVPGAFLSRLVTFGTNSFTEILPLTILNIHLPELNYLTPIEQTHQTIRLLQTTLYEHEGSVDKINMDDEGIYLVAAFGLPPVGHQDDAYRAVQFALAMAHELQKAQLPGSIGVSSGLTFCGIVGNEQRREYSLLGEVARMADQLMRAGGKRLASPERSVSILCDGATYETVQRQVKFEPLAPLILAGAGDPVTVYQPLVAGSPS